MDIISKHFGTNDYQKGVMVVNYPGIGDAMLAYPVISSLIRDSRFSGNVIAYPCNALYIDNSVRDIFQISKRVRLFSSEWYKFEQRHWSEIVAQAKDWGIGVILNIQNEGYLYDRGYYRFKEAYADSFTYWDMDFDDVYNRSLGRHILHDVRTLLEANGVVWHFPKVGIEMMRDPTTVVIFIGGSEINKRWGLENWGELLQRLASQFTHLTFIVLSGSSCAEIVEARQLAKDIKCAKNVHVRVASYLSDNLRLMGRAMLIVTHDSYPIHFAGITSTPVVGIYFSTDPVIWGSFQNTHFDFVASRVSCDGIKQGTGNCRHFHSGCPDIEVIKSGVTVEGVLATLQNLILELASIHGTDQYRWKNCVSIQ